MKTSLCLMLGVDGDGRLMDNSIFAHMQCLHDASKCFDEFNGTAFVVTENIATNADFRDWMFYRSRQMCIVKSSNVACKLIQMSSQYELSDVTVIGTPELVSKIDFDLFDDIFIIGPAKKNADPEIKGLKVLLSEQANDDYILYTMDIDRELSETNVDAALDRFLNSPEQIPERDMAVLNVTLPEMERVARDMDKVLHRDEPAVFNDDDDDDVIDPVDRELLNSVDRVQRTMLLMSQDVGHTIQLVNQQAAAMKNIQERVKNTEDAVADQFERNYQWAGNQFRETGTQVGELRNQFGVLCTELPDTIKEVMGNKLYIVYALAIIAIILGIVALVR